MEADNGTAANASRAGRSLPLSPSCAHLPAMPRLFDVSIPIVAGGVVYPGNPGIRVEPAQRIARGESSNVSVLSMGTHTGTHVDAPWHILDDGGPVDEIPLERLLGPCLVIAIPDDVRAIDAALLRSLDLGGHRRVLFRTRNSALLAKGEFVRDYTYLTPDAAEYLVLRGVELVGVDYYSVEQFHSGHHGAHKALLRHGVVIVEGLNLLEPPPGEYQLHCLPLRLKGMDGAPARAVLAG